MRLVAGAEDQWPLLARLDQPLHAGLVHVDAVVDAVEHEVEQPLEQVDDQRIVAGGDLPQVLARFLLHAAVGAATLAGDLGEGPPQLQVAQRLFDHPVGRLERRAGHHPDLPRQMLVQPAAHPPGNPRRLGPGIHRVHVGERDCLADFHVAAPSVQQIAEEGADGARLLGIAEEGIAP